MAKPPPDPADPEACYQTAMRSLALRWHGEKELRTKLARRGFDTEAIQSALLGSTQERWIDDERYARPSHGLAGWKHLGPDRIVRELRGRGVDALTASRSVAAAAEEDPGGDRLAAGVIVFEENPGAGRSPRPRRSSRNQGSKQNDCLAVNAGIRLRRCEHGGRGAAPAAAARNVDRGLMRMTSDIREEFIRYFEE